MDSRIRTRLLGAALLVSSGLLGVAGCGKQASSPPPPTEPVEAPAAEEAAPTPRPPADVSPAPAPSSVEQGLPAPCTKLIACCDAWVQTTPTARVGCDAQRQAFRAANTPEAKADLAGLCQQALDAWVQLPNIPVACK